MFMTGLAVVTAPIWLPVYLALSTVGVVTIITATAIVVMVV